MNVFSIFSCFIDLWEECHITWYHWMWGQCLIIKDTVNTHLNNTAAILLLTSDNCWHNVKDYHNLTCSVTTCLTATSLGSAQPTEQHKLNLLFSTYSDFSWLQRCLKNITKIVKFEFIKTQNYQLIYDWLLIG